MASRGLSVIKRRGLEKGDGSWQESVGRSQRAEIGGQISELGGPVFAQGEGDAEQADDEEEGVFVHSFFAQEFVGDLRDFGVGVFAHGLIAG